VKAAEEARLARIEEEKRIAKEERKQREAEEQRQAAITLAEYQKRWRQRRKRWRGWSSRGRRMR